MAQNSYLAIPLTGYDSSLFPGGYVAINPNGLPNACSTLKIINDSNENIKVSYDGINDHDFVASDTTFEFPTQINAQPNNYVALFSKGTIVYVTLPAAGVGLIYLSGYFSPS